MISVGLFSAAITLAIVNVLPEPVTPSSVLCLQPLRSASTSCAIASGWSPVGLYSETSLKSMSQS